MRLNHEIALNTTRFLALGVAAFAALVFLAWALWTAADEPTADPFLAPDGTRYCYTVIDHRGDAHPSEAEIRFIPGVEAYYEAPGEMGVVVAPYAVRIDRECLCAETGYKGDVCEGVPGAPTATPAPEREAPTPRPQQPQRGGGAS